MASPSRAEHIHSLADCTRQLSPRQARHLARASGKPQTDCDGCSSRVAIASAAAGITIASRPIRGVAALVARRSLGARRSRAAGWKLARQLTSTAYIAWSLWLIALGVRLSA